MLTKINEFDGIIVKDAQKNNTILHLIVDYNIILLCCNPFYCAKSPLLDTGLMNFTNKRG